MRSWRGQEAAPKAAIRHIPALDGLRGLAVAGVLLFHGGHLTGGYLGVDLFFVLSGFLITSLLLAESAGSGSVGLGGFWARRARRLLPALGGVLLAVACTAWCSQMPASWLRSAAMRSRPSGTARIGGRRSLIRTISLVHRPVAPRAHLELGDRGAVLRPMAIDLRRTARLVEAEGTDGRAGHIARARYRIQRSDVRAVQPGKPATRDYGTDTRAGGILLGAALAAWLVVRGPVSEPRRADRSRDCGVGRRGLPGGGMDELVGAVATAVPGRLLPLRGCRGGRARRSHPPRARAGGASAGLQTDVPARPDQLRGLPVALAHRRGAQRGSCPSERLVALCGPHRGHPRRRGAVLPAPRTADPAWRAPARSWRVPTPTVAIGLALVLIASTLGAKTEPVNATADIVISNAVTNAQAAPPGTERLMVVGNSVSFFLGEALTKLQAKPRIVTLNVGLLACLFPDDIRSMRVQGGPPGSTLVRGPSCTTSWRRAVNLFHPDVVLFVLSGAGQREARLGGNWVHACQPAFDQNLAQGFRHAISTLSARGAKVVLTTAAYSRSYGQTTANDRYVDCDNRVRRQVAAATDTPLIDLFKRTCRPNGDCPKFENGVKLRPDGLHYKGAGAQVIAQWIVGQLHARGACSSQTSSRNASTTSFRRFESAAASWIRRPDPGHPLRFDLMRIGMVCPYSLTVPGGVQSQVLGLVRALGQRVTRRGHSDRATAPLRTAGSRRSETASPLRPMARSRPLLLIRPRSCGSSGRSATKASMCCTSTSRSRRERR